MTDDELREVTRQTAEMLFGPPKKGAGAYQLWRQFDPELARQMFICHQMLTDDGVPTTIECLKICKEVLAERGLWQED